MSQEIIEKFYSSFQKKDINSMLECYHKDVEFSDPIFQLNGWKANAMWMMLIDRGKDMELSYGSVEGDDKTGKAKWEAKYTFSKTGNKIHNQISATFEFKEGKIIKHKDSFDLWKWCSMALGLKGLLFGWLPMIQNEIRREANSGLELYIKRKKLKPE
ncbi:MAG: nuclear transport factor 2 family protein [Leptospiraceae bacterium]|nr:nuclear transport factor 2 family protein [Leptospiraceae bacterium]